MQGYQGGVLLLGGTLGIAELFARHVPQSLFSVLASGQVPSGVGAAPTFWGGNLGVIVLTLVFIGGTVYVAGLSDDMGKLMLAVVIAAWLLFLVKNASNLTSIFGGSLPAKSDTSAQKAR